MPAWLPAPARVLGKHKFQRSQLSIRQAFEQLFTILTVRRSTPNNLSAKTLQPTAPLPATYIHDAKR